LDSPIRPSSSKPSKVSSRLGPPKEIPFSDVAAAKEKAAAASAAAYDKNVFDRLAAGDDGGGEGGSSSSSRRVRVMSNYDEPPAAVRAAIGRAAAMEDRDGTHQFD
jgi:hypothetical protein